MASCSRGDAVCFGGEGRWEREGRGGREGGKKGRKKDGGKGTRGSGEG